MSEDDHVKHYTEKAREARRIAGSMRFSESREQLLKVARAFENLAARLRHRYIRLRDAAD